MKKAKINEANKKMRENLLRQFEQIEYHEDVDIDKFVDVQMNEKIKGQLKDIYEKIEEIGKMCDSQYKKSYNMLKNKLDNESSKIDSDIKNYISNLREELLQYKLKINFDYKGKYQEITKQLDTEVEKVNVNTKEKIKLEKKFNILKEDEEFYKKQLENITDMNIYLKYKLNLLIKEYNELNNYNNFGFSQIPNEQNDFMNIYDNNNNIDSHKEDKPKKIIKTNDDNLMLTGLNKYEAFEDSEKNNSSNLNLSNENDMSNFYQNNQSKFTDDQIKKVNKRFDYLIKKLIFDIENEDIEYSNLKEVFDKLYVKTNNMYINILKNTHNEQKNSNSLIIGNNSSSISYNNQSTLPSIYQSTNSSKSNSKNVQANEGYMSKKRNKELIIKFLEKEEIKKIIYKLIYEE